MLAIKGKWKNMNIKCALARVYQQCAVIVIDFCLHLAGLEAASPAAWQRMRIKWKA